ncbi:MAG: S8 family serine peptidase [Sedimentisphaerales bacterium]|nr:S8 family serine peptidase [Sedimentisphaerales bacterium]
MAVRYSTIPLPVLAAALVLSLPVSFSSAMTLTDALNPIGDHALFTLDGQSMPLSLLRGNTALLLFGSTDCPHCRVSLDTLERIYNTSGAEVLIFFVAAGQDATEITDFFGEDIPSYSILLDPQGQVTRRLDIKRIPTCVFIDGTGLIQYKGSFNEGIARRLIAGERPVYPDKPRAGLRAADRFDKDPRKQSRQAVRYIVELDEKPGFSKKLSKAALKARRKLFRNAAGKIGARVIHDYGKIENRIVVEIPPEDAAGLRQLPRFKRFKEDRRVKALLEDSVYQIRADYAWDNAITGQGVKVCVVDTGIDHTHPDLLGKVVERYNSLDGSDNSMDDNGHGTHCAGIIASEGVQYRGVSHDVSLMAAKVLDYSGSGFASDVVLGVQWCVEQEADVISLSLGEGLYSGTCDEDEMAQAVNSAVDAGVVVACAAGNDGDSAHMVSPACASKAIAVGAVDKIDNIASYSDGGIELDLVAPGGDQFGGTHFPEIVSTFSTEIANNPFYCMYLIADECWDQHFSVDGNRYIRAVGTSMAAPHVAAAAALLIEANKSLTPVQVKNVLEQNADDLGPAGWDNVYGWGRINLEKALDNIPPETGELIAEITEPNASASFAVGEEFDLAANIDCFGGDGCGDVLVYAEFCRGRDCNDYNDIAPLTPISTLDNNPNSLGILTGYSVDTNAPLIFDAQTMLDISEAAFTKSLNPTASFVGSTIPGQYSTGDLESADGVGAIGEDVAVHYDFHLPAGTIKNVKVRLENYIVSHWVYPPFAGWYVYTSNETGDNLHLIGDCIPAEGGGGETPSPDCWFISEDANVIGDFEGGATNYIKLVSHDVDEDGFGMDFLTFNDIEVIVEYQPDPENDSIYRYYLQFDINDIDPAAELTGARLQLEVTQPATEAVAEVRLVDNSLVPGDSAQAMHEAAEAYYSTLTNPIKTFTCENTGPIVVNLKAAVEEALLADEATIAFQITERNSDQLVCLAAAGSGNPPVLTVSQKVQLDPCDLPDGGGSPEDANNGPRPLNFDTIITRDISEDTYTMHEAPASAGIGAAFASEYNTGDLEPNDGIGAIGIDAEEHYEFTIPEGIVKTLKVRLENYIVSHWVYPPYAGWYVYTSNASGDNLHLVGDCIPAEGGGGEAPSPDCWFVSSDPDVLADLTPGATNYIKLVSHDVDDDGFGQDFLTFNDIEVITEYAIDPNNDNVGRYYLKFDISDFSSETPIDSATLNFHVTAPALDAIAQINLVKVYDPFFNTAYAFYAAEDADYSSLVNPIKTFACDTAGLKQANVKAALEDAIESGRSEIAFLITEQNEDALFAIDANNGDNPPALDVYVKSGTSAGRVKWRLVGGEHGDFKLRVRASNDIGVEGLSDTRVVNIYDPNLPVIHSVECMIDSAWQDCRVAEYGDTIQKIRIDADDPQETPQVRLTLRNVPDDHNFVDEQLAYSEGYFTHEANIEIADSGQWLIKVLCTDSDTNTAVKTITWNIPWGVLAADLLAPTSDIAVPKSSTFDVQTQLRCLDAECPAANLSLKINEPIEIKYDDSTPESYADIGWSELLGEVYIAVQFTPDAYPATLSTARFYVWDTTTYPFELHIWDDTGDDGLPGTELISPFVVDPVVPSGASPDMDPNIAWFDIDLSAHDIVIDDGGFYIGWKQLEEGKNNQVGLDMNGSDTYDHGWVYGGWILGWLPQNYLCSLDATYCGNIMIRAEVSTPGTYSGVLPMIAGRAPLYTSTDNPRACSDMDAGDDCRATFQVHTVGAVAEEARLYTVAANTHSLDTAAPLQVTITTPAAPCHAANLNAIGPVDFGDFALLALQWLAPEPDLAADIEIDGDIDALDLAILAHYWLNFCE